jgi:hypothetical protein
MYYASTIFYDFDAEFDLKICHILYFIFLS